MSKTLLQQVYSRPNLKKAWGNLKKSNPYSRGLSNVTIEEFSKNLDRNLNDIHSLLREKKYYFAELRAVPIKKSDNKIRPLRIPEISDRLVLKAVSNIITPILIKHYPIKNEASFAYQEGLNIELAFKRIKKLYNVGNKVALKIDIIKFFDTVQRKDILYKLVIPKLTDESLNNLLMDALNQDIGNISSLTEQEKIVFKESSTGIQQGNTLSPLFSNIYLADFDNQMLKEGYGLVRYADDILIMCKDNIMANNAYNKCRELLEKLGLKVHPLSEKLESKSVIRRPSQEQFDFLSIRFDGKNIWPDRSKYISFREKLREIAIIKPDTYNVPDFLIKLRRLLQGWLAAYYFTDVDRYFNDIDNYINKIISFGLRKRQWKLKKTHGDQISDTHRKYTGIHLCTEIIDKLRKGKDFPINDLALKEIEDNVFAL